MKILGSEFGFLYIYIYIRSHIKFILMTKKDALFLLRNEISEFHHTSINPFSNPFCKRKVLEYVFASRDEGDSDDEIVDSLLNEFSERQTEEDRIEFETKIQGVLSVLSIYDKWKK